MKYINSNRWVQVSFGMIPLIISIIYCLTDSIYALAATLAFLFLMVGFLPVCKKRENLWMFVFSSVSLFPADLHVSLKIVTWLEDEHFLPSAFLKVLTIVILVNVVYCLSEVFLAVITRFLWKRQYKVEID